jgi:hypothetical protein
MLLNFRKGTPTSFDLLYTSHHSEFQPDIASRVTLPLAGEVAASHNVQTATCHWVRTLLLLLKRHTPPPSGLLT